MSVSSTDKAHAETFAPWRNGPEHNSPPPPPPLPPSSCASLHHMCPQTLTTIGSQHQLRTLEHAPRTFAQTIALR